MNEIQQIIGRDMFPPKSLVSYFENELNSLFNDPFFKDGYKMMNQKRLFPKMNVKETDTSYIVEIALPGFDKKNIKLTLESNRLRIESKLTKNKNETNDNFLIREISSRCFMRTIPFPKEVDIASGKSSMSNGVLTVTVNKEKEEKTKEVVLEVE
jgi:HSP20 family protein